MDYLPLFLSVAQRPVLLVGGGVVAARKLMPLLRAGADVTVVAPEMDDAILAHKDDVQLEPRGYKPEDLEGQWLVVAASDDEALNETVSKQAQERRIWANVVDRQDLCSAIFPSLIDREPLLVAISTGGASPTLARMVRGWIEDRLPQRLSGIARFLQRRRRAVATAIPAVDERMRFWQEQLDGALGALLQADQENAADKALDDALAAQAANEDRPGLVVLVGAGPGDPELLTLKGLRYLRSADVVLYDNLANQELLEFARRDAQKIYVGKKRALPGTRQEAINDMLLEHALAGRQVVRLKGGDPFIFGRGGEEIAHLAAHGVDFVVVPGISAAMGGASAAGIPLTHRELSQSVRFVTGHRASDRTNMDWPELARSGQTLVIYMGLPGLTQIMDQLMDHGMSELTPAALLQRATLTDQRAIVGTVGDLAEQVAAANVRGPTLIIVGDVVAARSTGELQMPTTTS